MHHDAFLNAPAHVGTVAREPHQTDVRRVEDVTVLEMRVDVASIVTVAPSVGVEFADAFGDDHRFTVMLGLLGF